MTMFSLERGSPVAEDLKPVLPSPARCRSRSASFPARLGGILLSAGGKTFPPGSATISKSLEE
jgi:hypothetical protein